MSMYNEMEEGKQCLTDDTASSRTRGVYSSLSALGRSVYVVRFSHYSLVLQANMCVEFTAIHAQ